MSEKVLLAVNGTLMRGLELENNLKEVVEAGADAVVVGRAVFKAQDFKKAYDRLIDLGRSYERECRNKKTD